MAIIETSTTISVGNKGAVVTEADIRLLPASSGTLALRKLVYPNNELAPLIYCKNPDEWTNFDTEPLVKRPSVAAMRTLAGNRLTGWKGFSKDALVTETWRGGENEASLSLDCVRQLYAYYENPPDNAFIEWHPRDRTNKVYHILIDRVTVDGEQMKFDFLASHHGYVLGDVNFSFYIIGEVS